MIKKVKITPDGVVMFIPDTNTIFRFSREESSKYFNITSFPDDTTPEVVHLEISNKCNLRCKECYVDKKGEELSTAEWKKIINQLAESGVFQITFGGGEPTLRNDYIELAEYANSLGLNVCMTTNGFNDISDNNFFKQINISWHNQSFFEDALENLYKKGFQLGINFVCSKNNMKYLDNILKLSEKYEAEVLLLAYKPVNGDIENQVDSLEIYDLARQLHTKYRIAVDGMVCNVCLASKKFSDIDSLGNVFVCSFIRNPIGNLLKQNFEEIWNNRPKDIKCPFVGGKK